LIYEEIFLVDAVSGSISKHYGKRKKLTVVSDIMNKPEMNNLLSHIIFKTAYYLNNLHENNKCFHGDIKPDNIFFEMETHNIYTDCGSIIHLHNYKSEKDENFD
jgi:serine/threonine protein kinase